MTRKGEMRHIYFGPEPNEKPRGFGIAGYRVTCPGDSSGVLDRLRKVLLLGHIFGLQEDSSTDRHSAEPESDSNEGAFDEINKRVDRECFEWYDDMVCEQMEFTAQLRDSCSDWRDWRWWDARLRTDDEFLLLLDVSGWPLSGLDALRRMAFYCGAESFEEIPEAEW